MHGTSANKPLAPVAENSGVILERIYGLIERDGQGPFVVTEKGKALQALLGLAPEDQKEEVTRQFLGI